MSNGDEREKPATHRDDPIGRLADIATGLFFEYLARATTIISSREAKRAVVDEIRRAHAGTVVRIGKGVRARREVRNEAIAEEIAAGVPLVEVARRHHLSIRQAQRIARNLYGKPESD